MSQRASISEKNVGEEFFLTPAQLARGVEQGKLTFTTRVFNGSSYKLYSRPEIVEFAKGETQDADLKAAHEVKMFKANVASKKTRLDDVVAELDGMDAKKAALGNEKQELEQWLILNDARFRIKYEKEEAIRRREREKIEKENKKAEKALRLAQKANKEAMKRANKINEQMMEGINMMNSSSAMYYSQPSLYQTFNILDNKKRALDSIY